VLQAVELSLAACEAPADPAAAIRPKASAQ